MSLNQIYTASVECSFTMYFIILYMYFLYIIFSFLSIDKYQISIASDFPST